MRKVKIAGEVRRRQRRRGRDEEEKKRKTGSGRRVGRWGRGEDWTVETLLTPPPPPLEHPPPVSDQQLHLSKL